MNETRYKAAWSDWKTSHEHEVGTWSEALEVLGRVGKSPDPPPIVEFFEPMTHRTISIGMGRESSVVDYRESLDPPYYVSLGSGRHREDSWFCYGNERTEVAGWNLIPNDDALRALEEFFIHAGRPKCIKWEIL